MKKSKGGAREKWPNSKVAEIGFWMGRGRSSPEIAELLADGTLADTIRGLCSRWNLPRHGRAHRAVHASIPMSCAQRGVINRRAKRLGLTPERFILDVAFRVAQDDLYHAVMDGD
jgi:hypothetical protein